MDLKNIRTKSDYQKFINKVHLLNTDEEKITFLTKLKGEVELFIGKNKRYKLFSSAESKLYSVLIQDMKYLIKSLQERIKSNEKTIKEFSDNKISLADVRTQSDYITWLGKPDLLQKLFEELSEYDYIETAKLPQIKKIIDDHFYIEGFTKIKNGQPEKIVWLKSQGLLVHLFVMLFSKELLSPDFYSSRYSIISKHFYGKANKKLNNKNLAKSYDAFFIIKVSQKNKSSNRVNTREILDKLIKEVLNTKIN